MVNTFPTFKVAAVGYKRQNLAYMIDDTSSPTKSNSSAVVTFTPDEQADPKTTIEPVDDLINIASQQIQTARENFEKEEQKKKGNRSKSDRIKQRAIVSPSVFEQLPPLPK